MIAAILLLTLATAGDTVRLAIERPGGKIATVTKDEWFSSDKFLHFSVSMNLVGLTYHVHHRQLGRDEDEGRVLSVSLTALAGLGKEIYDKKRKGNFSWKDLIYDAAGIGAGYLIFIR